MASWFRSNDMTYISIIVNEDAAHNCILELGRMGTVQFTDLNPELTPFQRRYVAYVKRIDEVERQLKFFGDEVAKFKLQIAPAGSVDEFVAASSRLGGGNADAKSGLHLLDWIEGELDQKEQQLLDLNRYSEVLTTEYNEKVEFQEVLLKSKTFFSTEIPRIQIEEQSTGTRGYQSSVQQGSARDSEMRFTSIAGVLTRSDKSSFERQLHRTTRGNCYVLFSDLERRIEDPVTGEEVEKTMFIVFFKSKAIEGRIKKVSDAFGARRYPLPDMEDGESLTQMMNENYSELNDARLVLLKNRDARLELCGHLADHLETWTWTALREKSVYYTLNMFKPDVRGILRGEGWVVGESLEEVQEAVNKSHATMDMRMPSMVEDMPRPWPTPPTFFKLNAFTHAFQEFVNTYGVPRYKEANPALFTAATFPFLYGVMYGDIGHGACIFLLGLYLVMSWGSVSHRRDLGELSAGLYMGRWMILMMGFFSVYAGLVYNDYFSIPLNLFGSGYEWLAGTDTEPGTVATRVGDDPPGTVPYGDPSNVYPFGVDPAWHVSDNELLFFNSMKMKMSVCIGIVQMTGGIVLKAMNSVYFHEPLDFFFEFIPMIIFDFSLFGYMVLLIFMKWGINWEARMLSATCGEDGETNWGLACDGTETTAELCPLDYGGTGDGCQPPNLITTLINIALAPGSVDEPMFPGQAVLQTFLLLIAFICIPVLLLAKPLVLKSRMDSRSRRDSFNSESHLMEDGGGSHTEEGHGGGEGGGGHGDESFGEICIHQGIETIEFVLGMVSNTASYLRLWALSLAHTELASVFWEKAMLSSIEMGNPVAIVLGFAVFFGVTFAVLLCMDVLECFLHALRLHWVEFQNKFYRADGYRFQPYSHKAIIESAPLLR